MSALSTRRYENARLNYAEKIDNYNDTLNALDVAIKTGKPDQVPAICNALAKHAKSLAYWKHVMRTH